MKIGLLLIATNKYKRFVPDLLTGVQQFFFPHDDVTVHIFTDIPSDFDFYKPERIKIVTYQIEPYRFPYATLYRYKIFTEHAHQLNEDYLIYSDVDMAFVGVVANEILPNTDKISGLFATEHPGFYAKGGRYYAGGFQGGNRTAYLHAAKIMSDQITEDEKNGFMEEWHDETKWNKYLKTISGYKVISPSYCMPDNVRLQIAWQLSRFQPKVLALTKNHEEIRS